MEKREDALREALQTNEAEKQRWTEYVKENEVAVSNLDAFSQHLEVEVMVPVGPKMLMYGHLRHTNEVLVGQFQGYFSKCSAHQAKEICQQRIKNAYTHLGKLQTEAELWEQNLEVPYKEGMFASSEEREIIEEYDEVQEERWREKHKAHVKQQKLRDKAEREKELKETAKDDDILKMLEERELMEELEKELKNLEVDKLSDENVRQLMRGEINIPTEKTRKAHNLNKEEGENIMNTGENVEKTESEFKGECVEDSLEDCDNDCVDIEDEDEELRAIKWEMHYLPKKARRKYLEHRIKIVNQKTCELKLRTAEDVQEKTRLFFLRDELLEMLEIDENVPMEEEIISDSKNVPMEEKIISDSKNEPTKSSQSRHISFALNDETLEFNRNESVEQMLPQTSNRDVINIDAAFNPNPQAVVHAESLPEMNKKQLIAEKVAKNVQYMHENQSRQDFSLIDQIIDQSNNHYPLKINFVHSENASYCTNDTMHDIPIAPADFYQMYLQQKPTESPAKVIFVNGYEGEDKVHVPILREDKHAEAYESSISEFCKVPKEDNTKKSILRNKEAVTSEKHSIIKKEDDEVVGKYVDTHAPKKRISRFRQMRQAMQVVKQ